ncbi:MAG: hypothetical protein ACREV4_09075, partial [Gammaproteobacteria bacterium]
MPETDRTLDYELTPEGLPTPLSDPKSLPASGVVGRDAAQPVNQRRGAVTSAGAQRPGTTSVWRYEPLIVPGTLDSKNSNLPPSATAAVPRVDLEQLLPSLDPALGFVDLKDGDTLPIAQTHVRVKGRAGSSFKLMVKGEEIAPGVRAQHLRSRTRSPPHRRRPLPALQLPTGALLGLERADRG